MKFIIIGFTFFLIYTVQLDATPTFPRVHNQLEQLQQQIISTTQTTTETHISDYRGNKRSDSRADKPESHNSSTDKPEPVSIQLTPSSTLNIRRDAYTSFVGNLIHNVRKGFRNAVERVQRLQNPEPKIVINTSSSSATVATNAAQIEQTIATEVTDLNADVTTDETVTPDDDDDFTNPMVGSDDDDEEGSQNFQIIKIISNLFQFLRNPNGGGDEHRNETDFKTNIRKLKTILLERKIKKITEFIINPLIISSNNLTGVINGNGTVPPEMTDAIQEKLTSDHEGGEVEEFMTSTGSSLLNREQARNLDNYGIMIMEVVGSVIGLTWGFISQLVMRG